MPACWRLINYFTRLRLMFDISSEWQHGTELNRLSTSQESLSGPLMCAQSPMDVSNSRQWHFIDSESTSLLADLNIAMYIYGIIKRPPTLTHPSVDSQQRTESRVHSSPTHIYTHTAPEKAPKMGFPEQCPSCALFVGGGGGWRWNLMNELKCGTRKQRLPRFLLT